MISQSSLKNILRISINTSFISVILSRTRNERTVFALDVYFMRRVVETYEPGRYNRYEILPCFWIYNVSGLSKKIDFNKLTCSWYEWVWHSHLRNPQILDFQPIKFQVDRSLARLLNLIDPTYPRHTISDQFKINTRDMKRKKYSIEEGNRATYYKTRLWHEYTIKLKISSTGGRTQWMRSNSHFSGIMGLHRLLNCSEDIFRSPIKIYK